MLSENTNYFTKDNLDEYLKELGKEYRSLNGKGMPAEIILIGGAAIIANYGFRDMTTDVDAVIHAVSSMKDAINCVGDKYNLPNGWLNTDFMNTNSYTPKLNEFSVRYRQFANVLNVRTVSAEYLVAMKLCSGRKYKKDLSDIIGILYEHEKRGTPLTMEDIDRAVCNLYGGWDNIPDDSVSFIEETMKNGNYEKAYQAVSDEEKRSKDLLVQFEAEYPKVTNTENMNTILENLKRRKKKEQER